jgi:hypothetical protein
MPLRRSTRLVILGLALAAIALVGESADPLGPDGRAGRRWHPPSSALGPRLAGSTGTTVIALADDRGRRWC